MLSRHQKGLFIPSLLRRISLSSAKRSGNSRQKNYESFWTDAGEYAVEVIRRIEAESFVVVFHKRSEVPSLSKPGTSIPQTVVLLSTSADQRYSYWRESVSLNYPTYWMVFWISWLTTSTAQLSVTMGWLFEDAFSTSAFREPERSVTATQTTKSWLVFCILICVITGQRVSSEARPGLLPLTRTANPHFRRQPGSWLCFLQYDSYVDSRSKGGEVVAEPLYRGSEPRSLCTGWATTGLLSPS